MICSTCELNSGKSFTGTQQGAHLYTQVVCTGGQFNELCSVRYVLFCQHLGYLTEYNRYPTVMWYPWENLTLARENGFYFEYKYTVAGKGSRITSTPYPTGSGSFIKTSTAVSDRFREFCKNCHTLPRFGEDQKPVNKVRTCWSNPLSEDNEWTIHAGRYRVRTEIGWDTGTERHRDRFIHRDYRVVPQKGRGWKANHENNKNKKGSKHEASKKKVWGGGGRKRKKNEKYIDNIDNINIDILHIFTSVAREKNVSPRDGPPAYKISAPFQPWRWNSPTNAGAKSA